MEDPTSDQRENPPPDVGDEAIFQVLRERHASQAKDLAVALWTLPSGRSLALVPNDDLHESYGLLIGDISASHHWPLPEVARYFGDPTPPRRLGREIGMWMD
ncbi:HD domain-containing protein [Bradyrhizobium betae]